MKGIFWQKYEIFDSFDNSNFGIDLGRWIEFVATSISAEISTLYGGRGAKEVQIFQTQSS